MEPVPRPRRWTIGELLAWTADRFASEGVAQPRVDAEHLLAHALGCTRLQLFTDHVRLPDDAERGVFRDHVRRRLAREPVAYIVGSRGFHALDLDLKVDARVLIPRPETEHLVDWLLESVRPAPAPPTHVLDVGTGSGAIALAVKRARPDLSVTGSDVSVESLAVAADNARQHALEVTLVRSDLMAEVSSPPAGWDVVAANLPYVPSAVLASLAPEVRRFEPSLALDGGVAGLDLIRRLVTHCTSPGALAERGQLFLEVGVDQAQPVAELLRGAGFEQVAVRRDLQGIERVVRGRRH